MAQAKFSYSNYEYTFNNKAYVCCLSGIADVDTDEDFEDGFSKGVEITSINDIEVSDYDIYEKSDVETTQEEIEEVIKDFTENVKALDVTYTLY